MIVGPMCVRVRAHVHCVPSQRRNAVCGAQLIVTLMCAVLRACDGGCSGFFSFCQLSLTCVLRNSWSLIAARSTYLPPPPFFFFSFLARLEYVLTTLSFYCYCSSTTFAPVFANPCSERHWNVAGVFFVVLGDYELLGGYLLRQWGMFARRGKIHTKHRQERKRQTV